MDAAEADVLASLTFPKDHWQKIYSTNGLERLNRAIKRRTEVVGIFPDEAAITRLVGAVLPEQNAEWAVQRCRYMTLETIAPLRDDANVRLTACPTRPVPENPVTALLQLHHARAHNRHFLAASDLAGCGHMSGLLVRSLCALALRKSDDQ